MEDLADQLYNLILLPGPEIRNQALKKIRNLANQVKRVNEAFPATKLLDRALIFNVLTRDSGNPSKSLTSLSQFALTLGHSFEAAGVRYIDKLDHLDVVKGDPDNMWLTQISATFNTTGCRKSQFFNPIHLERLP